MVAKKQLHVSTKIQIKWMLANSLGNFTAFNNEKKRMHTVLKKFNLRKHLL